MIYTALAPTLNTLSILLVVYYNYQEMLLSLTYLSLLVHYYYLNGTMYLVQKNLSKITYPKKLSLLYTFHLVKNAEAS